MGSIQEDTYLSDDSSFYGDEEQKIKLERRTEALDVSAWWKERLPSFEEVAIANMAKMASLESAKLYNPYQGHWCGRQLDETVEQFLDRLPPSTSKISSRLPWIFIANPFFPRKGFQEFENREGQTTVEGPREEGSQQTQFIILGKSLLQELETKTALLAQQMAGKPAMTLTKAIAREREKTIKKIKEYAVENHITSGKWMVFCSAHEVNAVWMAVARAVAINELGTAAKVAPRDVERDPYDREPRLICIYTHDFSDEADLLRVLQKLRALGLVETKGKPIYYKMDAYTYLDISSGNQWGIRPSLCGSAEMFKMLKDQKSRG